MVSAAGIAYSYPKAPPLFQELSVEIEPGGIVGLLGSNGAGKTTLLKLIAGVLFPNAGSVRLSGEPVVPRRPHVQAEIAYVPEQFAVPSVTVGNYARWYAPYYPRFDRERFRDYLRRFEVAGAQSLPKHSYGQQKKFLIAFALASDAKLVILDEPTNGMDIPSKQEFRRLIVEAASDQRTVIVSTHQVRDVERLIDPIIVLEDGKVAFKAAMETITDGTELRQFDAIEQAREADALATDTRLGQTIALVARDATGGEPVGGSVDLELLFSAAVNRPDALNSACGGMR